jgi:hypothetical protein
VPFVVERHVVSRITTSTERKIRWILKKSCQCFREKQTTNLSGLFQIKVPIAAKPVWNITIKFLQKIIKIYPRYQFIQIADEDMNTSQQNKFRI